MTDKSNNQGRAYEYAWITTLYDTLKSITKPVIENNSSFDANRRAWDSLSEALQKTLRTSAEAAVDTIIELEPNLTENNPQQLLLSPQRDGEGRLGDVRDIIISKKDKNWEIGLSIKHNHEAVKHSRLSAKLDFCREWFGRSCSDAYWKEINPIFEKLAKYKQQGLNWSDIKDKSTSIYIPLLQAFINEIKRVEQSETNFARKMVEYLVGISDYYKVVSKDFKRMTMIHTFNMHGSLNQNFGEKISAISVPLVELPTRLVAVEFRPNSENTVEMYLNNGWELSFRIHNASTKVETSLKFDIQFMGMPLTILNIECKWKND